MPKMKAMLFIDANKYLELYQMKSGRKLLALLTEQSKHVFITKQIVDEVHRNKMKLVCGSLTDNLNNINLNGFGIHDQYFSSNTSEDKSISDDMKAITKGVINLKKKIANYYNDILKNVDESKDEVSVELSKIFKEAVNPNPDEIKRARLRKELGNPPGKQNDPLGDEISWEQILSSISDKTHVWIITRDGDYWNEFNKKMYLNSYLKSEIIELNPCLNVYVFKDLLEGLIHFGETMKVDTVDKLSPEDIKEINEEEKALSIKSSRSTLNSSYTPAELGRTLASYNTELENTLASLNATSEIGSTLASYNAELGSTLAALHSSDIGSALNAELGNSLASLQSTLDIGIGSALESFNNDLRTSLDLLNRSAGNYLNSNDEKKSDDDEPEPVDY